MNFQKIKTEFISTFSHIILWVIIGGCCFYLGYKVKANQSAVTASKSEIAKVAQVIESDQTKEVVEIKAKTVDGVFWIKPNQEPICPEDYAIKGTFSSNNGNFYTIDNKSYNRVKPDICFATEEFAKDEAGFIKKF